MMTRFLFSLFLTLSQFSPFFPILLYFIPLWRDIPLFLPPSLLRLSAVQTTQQVIMANLSLLALFRGRFGFLSFLLSLFPFFFPLPLFFSVQTRVGGSLSGRLSTGRRALLYSPFSFFHFSWRHSPFFFPFPPSTVCYAWHVAPFFSFTVVFPGIFLFFS